MKQNRDYNLSSISSFSDFVIERKRLNLKKKLIETRLQFNAGELKEIVSLKRGISFDQVSDFIQKSSVILERIFKSDRTPEEKDIPSGT